MMNFGKSSADKYLTTVFQLYGVWYYEKPAILQHVHTFLTFFILASWISFLDLGVVLSDNLAVATDALSVAIPTSVCFVKTMNFYVNRRRMYSCLKRVHDFQLLDPEEKDFANNQLRIFFIFTVSYALICNLTITFVSWHVMWLKEPELPFVGWYPFDWEHNNRDFWIVQSIQFYGMFYAVNVNIACELFPCYFLTVIGCQLELLGMRLQKLNAEFSEKNRKSSAMIEKLIDSHVRTHYYIINLTQDVQKSFNCPFFVEICTVGVTITANAFQVSFLVARSKLGDHDLAQYAHYVTYIICTVFRIFLPCYFGNLVLSASEALQIRIYSSDWLNMSIPCRKKLITLRERIKRPTLIWAWILFPLTLEIFKSIINFSYTMLTLLQNMN
ncbi:hypothetical protein HA402_015503 [Bradysia odoriphaga]|nr:hypothetical protein HA402_015503 [Bradysia odoriphaga]